MFYNCQLLIVIFLIFFSAVEFAKQKRSVNHLMQQWLKNELPQLLKELLRQKNKCDAEA